MDRFLRVAVLVRLLLPEVVGKTSCGDLRGPVADGVDLVLRGDRGQHHRDGVEQAAEAHVLVGGRAGEAARLDDGPVRQGGAALVHDQVGHGLFLVRAVQVVPLGQADFETLRGDVAHADDAGIAVFEARRPGDDYGFREGAGERYAHPCVAHADLAGFDVQPGQFVRGLGLDGDVGAAGGALVVRHLQGGGVVTGANVGVAGRFAGDGAAVAEVPQVGGDGAVAVRRRGAVETDRERRRAAGRRGRGRGRGRLVLDDHRCGDHDERARRVGQPLRVRDREGGGVGTGRGVAVCGRGAGGFAAVAEAPNIASDAGAAGRLGGGAVEGDLQRCWACGVGRVDDCARRGGWSGLGRGFSDRGGGDRDRHCGCAGQALAVGHGEGDGVIAGCVEHVAGGGAGAGGAVAEIPLSRGDAAGGRPGVEGHRQRRRAVERCGGDGRAERGGVRGAGWVGGAGCVAGRVGEQVGQAAFRAVEEHRGQPEAHGPVDQVGLAGEGGGCRVVGFAE